MRFSKGLCAVLALFLCSGWTLNFNPAAKVASGTLSFKVNYADCPDDLNEIFDEAVDVWNGAPISYIKVERDTVTTSATATDLLAGSFTGFIVVCDRNYSTVTGANPNFTLAVAVSRASESGEVHTSGISINVQTTLYTSLTREQKIFTLAHEMGHVLGLGHSSDAKAIMHYTVRGRDSRPNVGQDDLDGLAYLYPRNELTGSDGAGWFGCGTLASVGGNGSGNVGDGPEGGGIAHGDGAATSSAASSATEFFVFLILCALGWQALRREPTGPWWVFKSSKI